MHASNHGSTVVKPESPLVSVVLCGYNQAAFVRDAIDSVLGQTYPHVELVAIDNGSTDDSREIMATYAGDPRVRLFLFTENDRLTRRLNEGIRQARGAYVSILYADDYYLPEKTAVQMEAFAGLGPEYGVVYSPGYRLNVLTGERWRYESQRVSGDVLESFLLRRHEGYVNPISPLIRREALLRHPYREEVFNEGEALFMRLAMTHKYFFVEPPLVVMREHLSNMGKVLKKNDDAHRVLMDRLERDPDFPPRLRRALHVFRGRVLRNRGWEALRVMNDRDFARARFREALSFDWRQAFHPRMVVGAALLLLPRALVQRLNRLANRLVRHKGNITFKEDYA